MASCWTNSILLSMHLMAYDGIWWFCLDYQAQKRSYHCTHSLCLCSCHAELLLSYHRTPHQPGKSSYLNKLPEYVLTPALQNLPCSTPQHLYGGMIDPWESKISISHNAYLKRFVLDGAKITTKSCPKIPDVILVDEAQDLNLVRACWCSCVAYVGWCCICRLCCICRMVLHMSAVLHL